MKKIVLFVITAIALFSCAKSNEEKAKALVESKLQTTMKDWASYEFIEMTHLDSVFTEFGKSDFMKEHRDKMLPILNATADIKGRLKECSQSEEKSLNDSLIYYKNIEDSLMSIYELKKKEFKGDYIGYKTIFTFRGNNSFGAKVINHIKVTFDKDITTILEMKSQD